MKMSVLQKDTIGYENNVNMVSPVPSQASDTPMLSPQFSLQGSPVQVQTATQGCLILHYAPPAAAPKQQSSRLQPIMPNTLQQNQLMRCKRRLDFSNFGYELPKPETGAVGRRNERERNRVKLINMTFATLRACIPARNRGQKSRKMSKVDTLKAAIDYIQDLQEILEEHDKTVKSANTTYNDAQNAMHVNKNIYVSEAKFSAASTMQSQALFPAFRNDNCFTTSPTNTTYSVQEPNCIANNNNSSMNNLNNFKSCNNIFHFNIQNGMVDSSLQTAHHQTTQHVPGYPYTPSLSPGSSGTVTNSPQPSVTSSDGSGNVSPDEEDLLDFTSWFN